MTRAAWMGVALVGGLAAACGGVRTPPGLPGEGVGASPDPEWTVRTLEGTAIRLGDLRGQPVLVNLWATWCAPCVAELPSLGRLARAMGDSIPGRILLVTAEDAETVRSFLRRVDPGIPVHLEETLAPAAFGDLVLPTTLVLDARGRIVLNHRGAAVWDRAEVLDLLRGLAREAG